jgi:chorismate mutase
MPDDLDDLARLRSEIDRIDDTIADLLIERMGHVDAIARAKGVGDGRIAIRPGREASILRRLTGRADKRLPAAAVVQIWREIISAATARQTPFAVAVQVAKGDAAALERARCHFGAVTPLLPAASSADALRSLIAGDAKVAVLGLSDPEDRWWARLQPTLMEGRYVFGHLPFMAADGLADAWLFGGVTPEPSGDDLTLVRLEARPGMSPDYLMARVGNGSAKMRHILVSRGSENDEAHLVELPGFLIGKDEEISATLSAVRQELLHFMVLGAYPRGLVNGTAG